LERSENREDLGGVSSLSHPDVESYALPSSVEGEGGSTRFKLWGEYASDDAEETAQGPIEASLSLYHGKLQASLSSSVEGKDGTAGVISWSEDASNEEEISWSELGSSLGSRLWSKNCSIAFL
jgi:hypothetical protein